MPEQASFLQNDLIKQAPSPEEEARHEAHANLTADWMKESTTRVMAAQGLSKSDVPLVPAPLNPVDTTPSWGARFYDQYGFMTSSIPAYAGITLGRAQLQAGNPNLVSGLLITGGVMQGIGDGYRLGQSANWQEGLKYSTGMLLDAGMIAGGVGMIAKYAKLPGWVAPAVGIGSLVGRAALDMTWHVKK